MPPVVDFMELNFRHYNARETLDAAQAWHEFSCSGGKMILAMAGAMSTGELGISLAQMIRAGKIHAISSTAANLEEDIFNLIAHDTYRMVPQYRDLTPEAEQALRDSGYNRVTDVCIPETVMITMEEKLIERWSEAAREEQSYFPYEYLYRLIREGYFDDKMQIPREHSWVIAACEADIPIYTPGFEDSTTGNKFTACVMSGTIPHTVVRRGTEQFEHLLNWYRENSRTSPMGFFQIGGGTAGDFAICAVPCLIQDLGIKETPLLTYFAQISDSTTSYGSYSGAVPNEKITWYKLSTHCPKFMINSDASIVAPLIFQYVLEKDQMARAEAVKEKAAQELAKSTPARKVRMFAR